LTLQAQVARILADPINLPPEFLDYLLQYAALNPIPSGAVSSPIISSTGLTGATKSSRLVGSTTSGAPTQGSFQKGDLVIAQDGHVWVCTLAGSPGTWVDASVAPLQAAAAVTFTGDVHLTTAGNTIEQGGVLTLKTRVADPVVAPTISVAYGAGNISVNVAGFWYAFVCYTWIDGSGHESAPSPVSNALRIPRNPPDPSIQVSVSVPALPTGATGFRIYAIERSGATPPAASILLRQAATTYVSSETASPTMWSTYNGAGSPPPGASTFPVGTAALIEDANGDALVSGDGAVIGKPAKMLLTSGSPSGTASVTPDLSQGNYFAYTYSLGPGTVTVNAPSNPPTGSQSAAVFLDFRNTSGGVLTYAWDGIYLGPGTTLPATTGPGASVRMMFVWNGTNWILYTKN
jgi:hypothetical protein